MVDQNAYLTALSNLPQAVFVITTIRDNGDPHGFTATSVTSVTVDPPTLVVYVNENNLGASIYDNGSKLGLHVLSADQEEVSNRFAGQMDAEGSDKFTPYEWSTRKGVPVLANTADVFLGEVERKNLYHDHYMVGVSIKSVLNRQKTPLIYMARTYHDIQVSRQ